MKKTLFTKEKITGLSEIFMVALKSLAKLPELSG